MIPTVDVVIAVARHLVYARRWHNGFWRVQAEHELATLCSAARNEGEHRVYQWFACLMDSVAYDHACSSRMTRATRRTTEWICDEEHVSVSR